MGFSDNVLSKVLMKLENHHINYTVITLGKKTNQKNLKKINKYDEYSKLALEMMEKQNKVDLVINKIKAMSKEDLDKVIEMIIDV